MGRSPYCVLATALRLQAAVLRLQAHIHILQLPDGQIQATVLPLQALLRVLQLQKPFQCCSISCSMASSRCAWCWLAATIFTQAARSNSCWRIRSLTNCDTSVSVMGPAPSLEETTSGVCAPAGERERWRGAAPTDEARPRRCPP